MDERAAALTTGNNGQRAYRESTHPYMLGHCFYKTPDDGNKCFVGVFIPDDVYDAKIDDGPTSAACLLRLYPGLMEFMPLSPEGMQELQSIHDGTCRELHEEARFWVSANVKE